MHIADLDAGRVLRACGGRRRVALVNHDRQTASAAREVLEGNVLCESRAAAFGRCGAAAAAPGFDACPVGGIDHADVFDENVFDDVLNASILAE